MVTFRRLLPLLAAGLALPGGGRAVAQSPSAPFATVGADHGVRLWSPGAMAGRSLVGQAGDVSAVALSSDGRRLFTVGEDHTVRFWTMATGALERSIDARSGSLTCVAAAADGKLLGAGGADGKVRIWNVLAGTEVATLNAGLRSIRAVAWNPDSSLLASGGDERVIQVWRSDGRLAGTIVGHDDVVTGLAWSPDGRTLVSAARDGFLKVWRIADFSLAGSQRTHDRAIVALALSPNGAKAVTAGADGKLHAWTITVTGFADAGAVAPDGQTTALSWDRGNDVVICGQSDGSIRYRRGSDLSLLDRVTAHMAAVSGIAVAPAGR